MDRGRGEVGEQLTETMGWEDEAVVSGLVVRREEDVWKHSTLSAQTLLLPQNFERAVRVLEPLELTPETEAQRIKLYTLIPHPMVFNPCHCTEL